MKIRKPNWKSVLIIIVSFIVFSLLFRYWDEVKLFVAGLFS